MADNKNIYFNALNESEKLSKLAQFSVQKKSEVTFWKKGSLEKHKMDVLGFIRSRSELNLGLHFPMELVEEVILYTFELNGLHFFGSGTAKKRTDGQVWIDCNFELYKSERRRNFRLLTYPHHKVYINLKVGKDLIDETNVLSFKKGNAGQTGIFQNFLNLLDESKPTFDPAEYIRFRVLDISVTGLAFRFGQIEASIFKRLDSVFKDSILEFNGEMLTIAEAELLYFRNNKTTDQTKSIMKSGMQFLNMDTNLDTDLSSIINKTLRTADSDFEGFI